MNVYTFPVTFEGEHIAPSHDAAAWRSCLTDGILDGCAMSYSGNTLTIGAGRLVACGRVAHIRQQGDLAIGTSTEYVRVVLTINLNLSGDNRTSTNPEGRSASNLWTNLTKDDINNGGTKYQMVVCIIRPGTGIIWQCGRAHSKGYGTTVTLPVSGWSNRTQTVYVNGILADTNAIITYHPDSQAAYEDANIRATSQSNGTITFSCDTVPSSAVKVNILTY